MGLTSFLLSFIFLLKVTEDFCCVIEDYISSYFLSISVDLSQPKRDL